MPVPKLNPRQWFWLTALALFLWAYTGNRMAPAAAEQVMRQTQGIVAYPAQLLMVPGSWLVTSVQGGVTWAIHNITATRHDTETVASLEEKNTKLEDDVKLRDGQIRILADQIRDLKGRVSYGIPPTDLLKAYIIGRNIGAGVAQLNIDKGTADGVKEGMEVIAGENCIVGRILEAHAKTSIIRLVTDPRFKVRAMIVRRAEGGKTIPLLKEPCLVEGMGNGQFYTNTIKTLEAQIEPGDVVQLRDEGWPAKLQYFILGAVSEVGLNPNQMLRYEVRSRANINDIQSVDILVSR